MPKKIRALRRGTALTRSERKQVGPVQIIVLGFDDLKFQGDILPELKRLRDLEIIRLVDMVIVAKSDRGDLVRVKAGALSEEDSAQVGAIAAALVGLESDVEEDDGGGAPADGQGAEARGFLGDERTWSVADVIPAGKMGVIALLEHRWAIPLRDAVRRAGGVTLADAWIHPDDLVASPSLA